MILYLIRKFALLYVAIILMMTFIAMAGGVPSSAALPKATFYAGFFAAGMTWFEIRRKGLWPLYDNLRISPWMVFGGLIGASTVIFLTLRVML